MLDGIFHHKQLFRLRELVSLPSLSVFCNFCLIHNIEYRCGNTLLDNNLLHRNINRGMSQLSLYYIMKWLDFHELLLHWNNYCCFMLTIYGRIWCIAFKIFFERKDGYYYFMTIGNLWLEEILQSGFPVLTRYIVTILYMI